MKQHRPFIRLGLGLTLIFSLGLTLAAEARFALIIGNAEYQELGKLKNPQNDAQDIAAVLQKLGFKVDLVINGSLEQMEKALVDFSELLKGDKDSFGFFYYAGHGIQSADGNNYLLPVGVRIPAEAFLKTKALALQSVLDLMQDSGNKLNVLVLDACRDNPFAWSRSASRGLAMVRGQPPGSLIAYATSAGSVAQDGRDRNGLYTTYLLKHLETPGLEIKDVFNLTGRDVWDASKGAQIPAVYNQFFNDAYLAGEAPAVTAKPQTQASGQAIFGEVSNKPGRLKLASSKGGTLVYMGRETVVPPGGVLTMDQVSPGNVTLQFLHRNGPVEERSLWLDPGAEILVSFDPPKAGAGQVLLSAGFDSGSLEGWVGSWAGTGNPVRVEADAARSGKGGILVSKRSKYWSGVRRELPFVLQGTQWYRCSAWVRYGEGSQNHGFLLGLRYRLKGKEEEQYLILNRELAERGRWLNIQGCFRLPDGENISQLTLYVESLDLGGRVAYPDFNLDDVTVELLANDQVGEVPVMESLRLNVLNNRESQILGLKGIKDTARGRWYSTDPGVAIISPGGRMSPTGPGSCTVNFQTGWGYVVSADIAVYDVSTMDGRGMAFDSVLESRLGYRPSADWQQKPPREAVHRERLFFVPDAGDQGKGDGALQLDIDESGVGFLGASLGYEKLGAALPKDSIITCKVRSLDKTPARFMLAVLTGSPDWLWESEGSFESDLPAGAWQQIIWRVPKTIKLAKDAVLLLNFHSEDPLVAGAKAFKGSFQIDDLMIYEPK